MCICLQKSIKQRLGLKGGVSGQQQIVSAQRTGKGILRQRIGRGGAIRRRTNIYSRLSGVRRINGGNRRGGSRGALRARLGNVMNRSQNGNNNNSLNSSLTRRRNALTAAAGNYFFKFKFYNFIILN